MRVLKVFDNKIILEKISTIFTHKINIAQLGLVKKSVLY